MPQFAVHRNKNPATRSAVPYLLDIQSELINDLDTRVVIPLYAITVLKGQALKKLTPVFEIEGKSYLLMTPQLAGIPRQQLGPQVISLAGSRHEIIAAIDILISGI